MERLRTVLDSDPRIAYALVFGSRARQTLHPHSDVDVAIGLVAGRRLDTFEIGELISKLESAAGRPADLVLLDEAPPGLAYRIFRDGQPVVIRDQQAFNARLARAVLEYLDFRPVEELCAQGVLAAGDGR